jgi:transposase-like protein
MTTRPGAPPVACSAFARFYLPPDVIVLVFVSIRRDAKAARRFLERAIGTTKVMPAEVVTDRAPTYPLVIEELLPAAWHRTDRYPQQSARG